MRGDHDRPISMNNNTYLSIREEQREILAAEIKRIKTELRVRTGRENSEPRTHYDSPGVDLNCLDYREFIAGLLKKPRKSLKDLEYLAVNELKASYDLAPGQHFILPTCVYPHLEENFKNRPQKTDTGGFDQIYYEYNITRNFERCLELISHYEKTQRRPGGIIGYENARTVECLKIKILYKQKDYARVIKKINALDFTSAGFRAAFYYTQRGLAKYKLKDYPAALDDYQRALKLKDIPGGPAVINWVIAQVYRKLKDYKQAAHWVQTLLAATPEPPVEYKYMKDYGAALCRKL